MAVQLSMKALAEKLPHLSDRPAKKPGGADALRFVEEPKGFVWPDLDYIEMREGSRVILIEAPGALGKSMAAEAVAATLGWPVIDTSKAQVGSYSLSGLIQDAFGISSTYLAELARGHAGVVIDSLDEAHLKAGTSNFEAFLDDLSRIAEEFPGPVSFLLFSRPDTASLIKLHFEVSDHPLSTANLSYFSYAQACDYIDSYMQRQIDDGKLGSYDVAFKFRRPFEELRDAQMAEITSSLQNAEANLEQAWTEVKNFLGYAPVLSVLSEFLAVPNPQAVRSAGVGVERGSTSDVILLEIIDSILLREQNKFQKQTVDVLRAHQSAHELTSPRYETLYAPREQAVRLVAKRFGCQLQNDRLAELPPSLVERYESFCQQFIADHPFWAGNRVVNVVFNDYLNARAAVDQLCNEALLPTPDRSEQEVGPFFHQFVHKFASRELDMAVVQDTDVPAIIYSGTAAAGDRANFFYLDSAEVDGVLLLTDINSRNNEPLEFLVKRESGIFFFPSQLKRGAIVTTQMVVLGQRGERFMLGPEVEVMSSELAVEANAISVNCLRSPGVVRPSILASRVEAIQTPALQSVDVTHPDSFAVMSEWARPVLQPYLSRFKTTQAISRGEYMDLRAILRSFRVGGGSRPTVYYELLDQRVVGSSQQRRNLLRRLTEEGVVQKDRFQYYLNTHALAEHGVNLTMVVSGEANQPVARLLKRLLH